MTELQLKSRVPLPEEDTERLPGYISSPESDELARMPTTDSTGHYEEPRQTTYETFVNDQLDALKAQLLAFHSQQAVVLRRERTRSRLETKESSSSLASTSTLGKQLKKDVVVDILTLPPVSESLVRKSHRKRSAHAYARSLSNGVHHSDDEGHPMWSRFTMTEANNFRQVWSQAVVGLLIAYVATVFPYKLAFLDFRLPECIADTTGGTTTWTCVQNTDEEHVAWTVIQLVVDICFWIDLTLNFLSSYRNSEDIEVCDCRLIAKRYLKGMFCLDVLACLPGEFFELFLTPNASSSRASPTRAINLTKLQRLSRLVRILRLRQLLKLAEAEWVQAVLRFRGFRMVGLAFGVMWVVHLMGSGWYIIAALEAEPSESWVARRVLPNGSTLLDKPPEVQWAHAMYFVLTVFTTVGFGDMSAFSMTEIVYVCMLMMVGGVVNGTVLSYVMSILEESDRKEISISRTVNTLKDFADHTQLSSSITHQMVTLARDRRVGAEVDSEGVRKLFSSLILPRHVVAKLPPSLWKGRLLKNDLFQEGKRLRQMTELPPRMVLFVASMLSMREFDQEEIIYSNGDLALNIFLVLGGVFAYVAVPQGYGTGTMELALGPYQLLGPRSYFGEIEMLTGNESRVATVRCESPSATALLLSKVDIVKLCEDFPVFTSALKILSLRREASRQRRLARLVKLQNYEQLSCEIIAHWAYKLFPHNQAWS